MIYRHTLFRACRLHRPAMVSALTAHLRLVPTRETLDLLQDVDFSSFDETSTTQTQQVSICLSDSDDPFDSDDMDGLLSTHFPRSTERGGLVTVKSENYKSELLDDFRLLMEFRPSQQSPLSQSSLPPDSKAHILDDGPKVSDATDTPELSDSDNFFLARSSPVLGPQLALEHATHIKVEDTFTDLKSTSSPMSTSSSKEIKPHTIVPPSLAPRPTLVSPPVLTRVGSALHSAPAPHTNVTPQRHPKTLGTTRRSPSKSVAAKRQLSATESSDGVSANTHGVLADSTSHNKHTSDLTSKPPLIPAPDHPVATTASPFSRPLARSGLSLPQPFKIPRLQASPKVTSYFSQEAFRQFSTVKKVSPAKAQEPATLFLETQRPPMLSDLLAADLRDQPKAVLPVVLTKEQNYVLQLAKQGKSIFFTGSAGTGKSVLLKNIIKALRDQNELGRVAVTASTGFAACAINGVTLHSFAGIGLGKGSAQDLAKKIRKNRKAKRNWLDTDVLVIDEISMIDGELFLKLDYIGRDIRRNHKKPFGGMQVIICGDFYQLPPVSKNEMQTDGSEVRQEASFAFESKSWRELLDNCIVLKEVFRQKGDQVFIEMLNDMRHGVVSSASEDEFLRLSRPLHCPDGIVPTELFATRAEVEFANNYKLSRLEGAAHVYDAQDGGSLPFNVRNAYLSNFLAPQRLFLKKNAQVMCIKNFDSTLVNGTLGKVIDFVDRDTYLCSKVMQEIPHLNLDETVQYLVKKGLSTDTARLVAETNASVDAPETLLGIMTLLRDESDDVFGFLEEMDGSENAFRSKAPSTSAIVGEQPLKSTVEERSKEYIANNRLRKVVFLKKLRETSKGQKFPLVRFETPDRNTTRDVLVEPEVWNIEDEKTSEILVSRAQLPLMLAWALSIHKSQGQTLKKVKIDLSRVFERGQAYVGLSRAVSREGLQVLNFSKHRVRAHPAVEQFYLSLSVTEDLASRRELNDVEIVDSNTDDSDYVELEEESSF